MKSEMTTKLHHLSSAGEKTLAIKSVLHATQAEKACNALISNKKRTHTQMKKEMYFAFAWLECASCSQ